MSIFIGIIFLMFLMLDYLFLVPMGAYFSTFFYSWILLTLFIALMVSIFTKKKHYDDEKRIIRTFSFGGISILLMLVTSLVIVFFSSPMFFANKYKQLLPKPQEKILTKEIQPFDLSKAPIVTQSMAEQIADKRLGDLGDIGSRAHLGDLTLQNVNGNLYWVAPFLHSGFFAWKNNKDEGTPYIMVNANNKECDIVQSKIKIQPNSFFSQDLRRILFKNDKYNKYSDFTFEIDDNGQPFWTATILKRKIGLFSGLSSVGTAVVNCETGEAKDYSIEDTPKWVDRIQPMDIAVRNVNYYGKYINGFRLFNHTGKFKATQGTGMFYNNGKCYFYTGITSIGKDESSLGFYLIDTRTLETTYFKMSGATETSAMKAAEGRVQNLGYTGSFPILMNVENNPTYFVPLQDKNNITSMYAMVNVQDYTIVATGKTADECRDDYLKQLSSKNVLINSTGEKKSITSTVKRINSYVQQGNTYYNVMLNDSDKVFVVPLNQSKFIPLTKEADSVKIDYTDTITNTGVYGAVGFDNLTLHK